MSLSGFDFQALNRRYLTQPDNDATQYAASINRAQTPTAWRCIGIHHLTPSENNGRRNVFVDVLDESGNRTRQPQIAWTWWWLDAPTQYRKLDKPNDEPAADIPIDSSATITLRVDGLGIPSDSVGNLHTRWADEGSGNSWGHHSYYVVFQLQRKGAIVPPIEPPTTPEQPSDLAAVWTELRRLSANVDAIWKRLDEWSGGK